MAMLVVTRWNQLVIPISQPPSPGLVLSSSSEGAMRSYGYLYFLGNEEPVGATY